VEKPKRYSMRKLVNLKCKECIYDPKGGYGTWRQQTEACTSRKCPLWPIRPVSKPKVSEKEETV
jgi:hypothetical protein